MLIALAILAATPSPPPADAAKAANGDPIVCHRPESEVGTHMRPKPVCMKKSEWDFVEKNTQNELRTLQDRSSFDPGKADGHRPQ